MNEVREVLKDHRNYDRFELIDALEESSMSKKWDKVLDGKRSRGIPRMIGDGRRIGFMHAHKGGAPVLKTESSWRTINGVFLNTKWGWVRVLFRRRG